MTGKQKTTNSNKFRNETLPLTLKLFRGSCNDMQANLVHNMTLKFAFK